ncbi:uncharacterized protein UV8b_04201 [Ustilaginoidea virens]|uniref:Uncharacterized protein n=1 Tax=Ustilaginoidea virens TaxID=1159556 RepID=A0A8E5HQS9_USTVR|nr:uncharacterized protein UV8b_04201 [Ustilaginoidea virens]QUC19960.1 hypothetical protein UV8b_04201 [Ustilaginoidea virens]
MGEQLTGSLAGVALMWDRKRPPHLRGGLSKASCCMGAEARLLRPGSLDACKEVSPPDGWAWVPVQVASTWYLPRNSRYALDLGMNEMLALMVPGTEFGADPQVQQPYGLLRTL